MSDKPKKINVSGFFDTESSAPSWDGGSTLTIRGHSPGGQRVDIVIAASAIGLGYLGRAVRRAIKKHEAAVVEAMQRATADE